jgi:replicative DNA helicase
MQTIEIRKGFKVGFDELIQSFTQLNSKDMDAFLKKLNQVTSQNSKISSSSEEDILLQQIKEIIPASVLRRFNQLQSKQNNLTITDKEQSEILVLTDFIEEKSAERLVLLSALAKIRQISVLELVQQIKLKDYHV